MTTAAELRASYEDEYNIMPRFFQFLFNNKNANPLLVRIRIIIIPGYFVFDSDITQVVASGVPFFFFLPTPVYVSYLYNMCVRVGILGRRQQQQQQQWVFNVICGNGAAAAGCCTLFRPHDTKAKYLTHVIVMTERDHRS